MHVIGGKKQAGTIYGANGKALTTVDPKRLGIEELIELNQANQGMGTGLKQNDIMTVIIYELARCKDVVLRQTDVIEKQDKIIKELTGGRSGIPTEKGEQQSNESVRN